MRCGACGADSAALKRSSVDCGPPSARVACLRWGAGRWEKFLWRLRCPQLESRPRSTRPAAMAEAPQAVAERRVCSVLFCDLVGFTPLSENRDPEVVRELLGRYFKAARTVIGRYGGTIEKFIGDAVMAVWGTPVAAEGDAERAVRAALDLVESVAAAGRGGRRAGARPPGSAWSPTRWPSRWGRPAKAWLPATP